MASPPSQGGNSLPNAPSLALPRQRPTLALPGQHIRKASITSASSASHPLRQTSFPPQDDLQSSVHKHALTFSPEDSLDDVSDGEINSVISGSKGDAGSSRKRKRGEKRSRGKQGRGMRSRIGSASVMNGEEGRSVAKRANAPSLVAAGEEADGEDEEEELEEDTGAVGGRLPLYEGGQMTADEVNEERERKRVFYESVPESHRDRSEAYHRAKLRTADVRRLINQTLSQSVPQNVVLVVASYTKLFAGILIEQARAVQAEWAATEAQRPDGQANRAFAKLYSSTTGRSPAAKAESIAAEEGTAAAEQGSKRDDSNQDLSQSIREDVRRINTETIDRQISGGAVGLAQDVEECDRGPLLPDHLREALRRYKKSRRGGPVGFTGLSLEGRDVAAPRMGGRKLFR